MITRVHIFRWSLAFAILLLPSMGSATWEVTGALGIEGRGFVDAPAVTETFDDLDGSVSLELEFYRDWDKQGWTLTVETFARWDAQDNDRRMFDLREFWAQKSGSNWDLRLGVGKVFWGVAESQHLVDVINQSDLRESVDGEAKLGQPMVNFDWITDASGTLGFYYLPYFREREFPGVGGRLRPLPPGELAESRYVDGGKEWWPSWAVRWSHSLGDFDVGLYHFDGINREPSLETVPGSSQLRPVYSAMTQQGLDLQWTHEAWLWKLEGLARQTDLGDHTATTVGFEYTFYGVAGSAIDVGVLGEHHYDSRGLSAPTLFDDDLFAAARIAWNDTQDTSLLAGVFYDRERGSTSWRVEYQRRLGETYRIQIEAQGFDADTRDFAMSALKRDTFVRLELIRYF